MTKCFFKIANFLLASLMLVGCDCCDTTSTSIISIGGAGDFWAINMATNDTLKISSGINISINDAKESLTAKNGNIIRLVFEPAKEYAKYNFSTEFVTHDSIVIENNKVYEYAIKDTKTGQYKVSMSASYKQNDDHNDIFITGGGSFYLEVKE